MMPRLGFGGGGGDGGAAILPPSTLAATTPLISEGMKMKNCSLNHIK